MGINRGRHHDGSVPQLAAHHFKVCPVLEERRGVGMPEGMEAAVAQGLFTPPVEVADTVRGEGAAVSVAADEGGVVVEGAVFKFPGHRAEMFFSQELVKLFRDLHGPDGSFCLWHFLELPPVIFHQGGVNGQLILSEVHIPPFEGAALADAEPGVVGKVNSHAHVAFPEMGNDFVHFLPGKYNSLFPYFPFDRHPQVVCRAGRKVLAHDYSITEAVFDGRHQGIDGRMGKGKAVHIVLQYPGRDSLQWLLPQIRKEPGIYDGPIPLDGIHLEPASRERREPVFQEIPIGNILPRADAERLLILCLGLPLEPSGLQLVRRAGPLHSFPAAKLIIGLDGVVPFASSFSKHSCLLS